MTISEASAWSATSTIVSAVEPSDDATWGSASSPLLRA
jgi:hypothetical protein